MTVFEAAEALWDSIPKYTYPTLKVIADDFLGKYWKPDVIPVNIEWIAETKMDFDIVPCFGLKAETGQLAMSWADALQISVDDDAFKKGEGMVRFEIAEQLATRTLYPMIFNSTTHPSTADWEEILQSMPAPLEVEVRRNVEDLAGLVTVPTKALVERTERLVRRAQAAGIKFKEQGDAAWRALAGALGEAFGVPRRVVFRRLRMEGLMEVGRWEPLLGAESGTAN